VKQVRSDCGRRYSSQLLSEIPIRRSGRGIHIFFHEPKVVGLFHAHARVGRRPTIVEDYMDPSLRSGFQKQRRKLYYFPIPGGESQRTTAGAKGWNFLPPRGV